MQRIENEFLTVDVNENGAELWSIKSKKTGIEYLWQGNAEYWKGRAPILFPICGRLFEGKYFYDGKEYAMPIHGIAKLFCFECKMFFIRCFKVLRYYFFHKYISCGD